MKIIIYGTEKLGLLYIEKNKKLEVVAFATNAPTENRFSEYPVIHINQIPNHDYDKVIIAVENWTADSYLGVIAGILDELKGVGVPFDKTLTLRPYFTYKDVNLKTFEECINVRSRIFRELSVILRRNKVPGSVAECGVGRGVFASVINESFPDKTLYLFDTFKGFDERDLDDEAVEAVKRAKECKAMFGNDSLTGIDVAVSHCAYKAQCIIRAGYIPETFEGLENEIFAFVNIDVDLYAPTLAALRFFAPRLAKGGVIWIHDYYSGPWQGVKKAINEFALEYEFTLLPVGDKLSVALIPLREKTNAKPPYHVEFEPEKGQQPLVSIIMPSLNVVNYIRECMESVINQTLKNIEIICVDADSNDGTLEILREYASWDKRITLVVSKKKSYGYQMNLGLDIATGKYMGIVETDDFVAHDMFEQLYKLAKKNNVDFIKADFYTFTVSPDNSLNKTYTEVCAKSGFYDKVFKPGDNPEAITFYPCTWSGIYNIDFLRRWKIRHNETPGASYQDNGFWIQTFCCAQRAYLLNKPFYMYRDDNPDSSKKSKDNVYCIIEEYAFILNFLKTNDLFNKTYIPVYLYKKYTSYIFTYRRIAEKFKLPFIIKFHEEFKDVAEEGLLDTSLFPKFKREILMQIINDPVTYYLKTSDYGKNMTTHDGKVLNVQNEVVEIKSSLSYKIGRAITFFPRKIVGGYNCIKDHGLRYTIRRLFFKITRTGRVLVTNKVKVSIIIPVYNVEKYLRECLDSAVNQTLRDIEIICINDGSTDGSGEILKEYESKDSRIKVASQENKGPSSARNVGIRLSQGEYIHFLDSDDYLEPNALELLYQEAYDNNLDIVYFDAKILYDPESMADKFPHFNNHYSRTDKYSSICTGVKLLTALQKDGMFHCNVQIQFINRQYLESIGLFFYEGIYHEDDLFTFLSILQANRVRHVNDQLLVRRIRKDSIMTKEKEFKHFYGYLVCYIQMLRFLSGANVFYNEMEYILKSIDRVLSNAFRIYRDFNGTELGWKERLTEFERYIFDNANHMIKDNTTNYAVKISVIIPIYNGEEYLRQCMDSVINQTLKELEIICVDDCSTDLSRDILQKYAAEDSRIRVISFSENKSAAQARKTGVLTAVGKYIMFVDSDDYLDINACEVAYGIAQDSGVDIVQFGAEIVNCGGMPQQIISQKQKYVEPYKGVVRHDNLMRACTVERKFNHILWCKLIKADICKQAMTHIEDGQFPRANDEYAFILIAYFAKTYKGEHRKLYYHCFGRGEYGRKHVSIERFEHYCSAAFVIPAIERFLEAQGVLEAYRDVIEYRRKADFDNCWRIWLNNLNREHLAKGVDLLISYFGKDIVICALDNYVGDSIREQKARPFISVIIPVYNAMEHMQECLDSVLSQTIENLEILCVDDGSTDNSLAVLLEYEAKDSRVRVLSQKNSGSGLARNNGINHAAGEYVAFMDSDDRYPESDVLEVLYTKAFENKANICGGSFSELRDGKIKTTFWGTCSKYSFQNEGIISYRDYQFDFGFHRFIYKRDFLISNQLYFPDYRRFQDPPFFVKAMVCADFFYAVPKVTYCYRIGHKEVQWDNVKTTGLVRGIIDILELTVEHQLPALHKLMVERLNHFTCMKPFIESVTSNNLELLELLLKANGLIDIEMLEEAGYPSLKLYKGRFILDSINIILSKNTVTNSHVQKKRRSLFTLISRGYQCYKDNGFKYTIKLAISRLLKCTSYTYNI